MSFSEDRSNQNRLIQYIILIHIFVVGGIIKKGRLVWWLCTSNDFVANKHKFRSKDVEGSNMDKAIGWKRQLVFNSIAFDAGLIENAEKIG